MLSSITPFGERSRNSRWGLTASAYLVGSVLGGAFIGAAMGLIGELVAVDLGADTALVLVGGAAVIGVMAELGIGDMSVPGPHRQVNERWLMNYRGWVYGLGFGFQLGLGVVTIVTTAAVWLLLLTAVLTGSFTTALALGATFGFVRGVFIFATAPITTPDRLRALHQSISHRATLVSRAATGAVALTALAALSAGVTS